MNKKISKICINILLILLCIFMINQRNKLTEHDDFIKGNYDRKFKDYVVFYPQHQDDEVLWGGSAIINAINQCSRDNVYVVLVSDGSGVNVFNSSKYANLTRKEKEKLRNNEFRDSLDKLGVKKENILILPDMESKEGTHYELMESTILKFEKELKSVTHVAHHYRYDDHDMHRQNGEVLKKLYDEGKVEDALYFIKPKYVNSVPINNRVIYIAPTSYLADIIKSSCEQYKIVDENNGKYGIGYQSAHSYFDELLKDPQLKSVLSDK